MAGSGANAAGQDSYDGVGQNSWVQPDVDRYYDANQRGWCFPAWVTLHAIVDSFPEDPTLEQRRSIKELFERVAEHLPCSACSKHFQQLQHQFPIDNWSASGTN